MQRLRRTRHRAPGSRFLDPRVLAGVGNLELVARTVVDGFMTGLHRSRRLGASLDFAEHRPYVPGDDVRRIDWRLYGRTDRYHVKEFEADTNADVMVLLDCSRSMTYGSRGVPKLDYARILAACLAYLSNGQRDRVGVGIFDHEVVDWIPPAAGRLNIVLHALDRAESTGDGAGQRGDGSASSGLGVPLDQIAGRLRRRGVVVLLSDFYEAPESARDAVRRLRRGGGEVIIFHVLDPAELEFPFDTPVNVRDLETGRRIPVVPAEAAVRYRERIQGHVAALTRLFAEEQVDYTLVDTASPLDRALHDYLAGRRRLARVR